MSSAPVAPTAMSSQFPNESPIIVDEQLDEDATSDVTSTIASSTTSLADSMFNFRVENGRTYHRYKDGKYSYPNDERESDRLDLQQQQFLHSVDGNLGLSPPNQDDYPAKRVLDIGTGTGIWAIEFGELKPEAEVIGIDLSPPLAE
ncbi:hypothetical protein CSPX01_16238 [Colletotrichum filicis]|nr:hypothetical protein CSPX01_16238 [Colletotrichum filicis]